MKKFKKPDSRHQRKPFQGAPAEVPPGRCVVGIHAVREILNVRPKAIDQLWFRDRYQDHPDLRRLHDLASAKGIRATLKSPTILDRIVGAHQGVMAFSREEPQLDWDKLCKAERACVIALDEVEDPHNVGAILRTAWLFGADAVLVPELRAAHLSPAVSKVAQGAVEHVPLLREQAMAEQLREFKDLGFWILGLSHKAKQNLFVTEVPDKVVWVLGSESSGLRKSIEGACDDLICIPQHDPVASYNVSVAAAVAMAETFRQRAFPVRRQ
jgi:23S rRNA (guanosine2251-2'-O)-methyltransferase